MFYVKTAKALEKSHHPLSQQSHLKIEILSSPPFLKIWLEAQPPPPPSRIGGGGGGAQKFCFARKLWNNFGTTIHKRLFDIYCSSSYAIMMQYIVSSF